MFFFLLPFSCTFLHLSIVKLKLEQKMEKCFQEMKQKCITFHARMQPSLSILSDDVLQSVTRKPKNIPFICVVIGLYHHTQNEPHSHVPLRVKEKKRNFSQCLWASQIRLFPLPCTCAFWKFFCSSFLSMFFFLSGTRKLWIHPSEPKIYRHAWI